MNIKISYKSNVNFLNEDEWTNLIIYYLNLIESTNTGKILLKYINKYIEKEFDLVIENYSSDKVFQYPFCKNNKNKVSINIPDTPYFIKVPILNFDLIKGLKLNEELERVKKYKPVNNQLDKEIINSFSKYKFQPMVVVLFHELAHSLRIMLKYNSNTEEESTIYGINGDTLFLDNTYITENSFRKDLKLEPRISHESEYYYVYGTNNQIDVPKETLKYYFKKIKLMI